MKKKSYPFSTKEEFLALCQAVSSRFDFLQSMGFKKEGLDLQGGYSFKDGFRAIFTKPGISVTIVYSDMELDFRIEYQGETISYYFIDTEIFGNQSGFKGSMFPREKLSSAAEKMASTIEATFGDILNLDKEAWESLLIKYRAPRSKKRWLPG